MSQVYNLEPPTKGKVRYSIFQGLQNHPRQVLNVIAEKVSKTA